MSIVIIVLVFNLRALGQQMWEKKTAVGRMAELIKAAGSPRGGEPTQG